MSHDDWLLSGPGGPYDDGPPIVEEDTMTEQPLTVAPANNPLAIIANAVEKGFDADQLGKLVDLHERIEAMNSKRAYQEAMQLCQAEMQTVVAEEKNTHTRSTYADLGKVIHKIKPVYTKHGFSLSYYEGETPKPGFIRCMCDVMHSRGHRETKWMDLPADGTGAKGGASAMNPVQGVGSTNTYARRYLLYNIFNLIVADTDMDGNTPEPTMNDEQREMIERLILESNADREKLLKWAEADRIADIPQSKFVPCRDFLQRKIAAQKAEAKP